MIVLDRLRSPAPTGYAQLLKEIKDRIQQSRTRAIFSVNAELIGCDRAGAIDYAAFPDFFSPELT